MIHRLIFLGLVMLLSIKLCLGQQIIIDTSQNISRNPANDLFAFWSPDGKKLVYQSDRNGNWDIFMYYIYEDTTIQITSSMLDEQHPVWHPTDEVIIFDAGNNANQYLYQYKYLSGQTEPLFDRQVICKQPSIAADGRMVYFLGVDNQHDNWELFSYHLIYDNLNQITQMKEDGTYLGLAWDGKSVIYGYESDFYPYQRLKIFNWYGNEIVKMDENNILYAGWHPDGLKMYFLSDKDRLGGELYSIWRDGTNEMRLTDDHFHICDFSISPGGKAIACSVFINGDYEIIIIQLESF